jgi:DNA-binding LacI/PurR family transcriptional regulator
LQDIAKKVPFQATLQQKVNHYFTSMKTAVQTSLKRLRPGASQLIERLRFELCDGHFAPGSRFFSNNTLAEKFGVSAPTAGKILDTLCHEGLLKRIQGSGTFVTENTARQRVTTYAIILWLETGHPRLQGNERFRMLAEFERSCIEEGRSLQIINLDNADCLQRLDDLLTEGLNGVLLLSPFDIPPMQKAIAKLKANQVPTVYWSDFGFPPGLEQAVRLQFDGSQCGRIATEHLLALGHKSIAVVYRSGDEPWERNRIEGYRKALAKARIGKRQQIIDVFDDNQLTPSHLIAHLQALKAKGCTAILASNDSLAHELILAGRAAGFKFPGDFSITGVDNNSNALLFGTTTVELPTDTMAKASLAVLENWGDRQNSTSTTVPCRLIIRSSTGQISR